MVVGQPITNPISGPSFDFTFTFGPELDNFSEPGEILWGRGGASVDLKLRGGRDGDGGAAPVLQLEPGQRQQALSLLGAHGALCEG